MKTIFKNQIEIEQKAQAKKLPFYKRYYFDDFLSFPAMVIFALWLLLEGINIFCRCDEFNNMIGIDCQKISSGITIRIVLFFSCQLTFLGFLVVNFFLSKKRDNFKSIAIKTLVGVVLTVPVLWVNVDIVNSHFNQTNEKGFNNLVSLFNQISAIDSDISNGDIVKISTSNTSIIEKKHNLSYDDVEYFETQLNGLLFLKFENYELPINEGDYNNLIDNFDFVNYSDNPNNQSSNYQPLNENQTLTIKFYRNSRVIISITK